MYSVRSDNRPSLSPNDAGTLSRLNRAVERAGEFGDKPEKKQTPAQMALAAKRAEARRRGARDYEAFRWARPLDLEGEFLDEWWRGRYEAEKRYSDRKTA